MKNYVHHILNPGLAIVAALLVFLVVMERLLPKHMDQSGSSSRKRTNFWLGVVYRLLFSPLFIAPLVLYITRDSAYRLHRPDWYGGALAFVLDIMLLDCLNYTMHFIAHKVPILWRFHAVHHLDTHLDSTTGLRQHFGEKLMLLVIRLPVMFLLAVPYKTVAIFETIAFCFGIFHHNNIRFSDRAELIIGKVIVMPSFHNVHHGREVQHTDSNYGFILSIWDRLFRTKSVECRPEGFSNGLDHHPDFTFTKLLYLPFTRTPVKEWE